MHHPKHQDLNKKLVHRNLFVWIGFAPLVVYFRASRDINDVAFRSSAGGHQSYLIPKPNLYPNLTTPVPKPCVLPATINHTKCRCLIQELVAVTNEDEDGVLRRCVVDLALPP